MRESQDDVLQGMVNLNFPSVASSRWLAPSPAGRGISQQRLCTREIARSA
jgi:hypothetical protein